MAAIVRTVIRCRSLALSIALLGAIGCSPAAPPETDSPHDEASAETAAPPPPPEGVVSDAPTQPAREPRPAKSSDRPASESAGPEAVSAQPLAPPSAGEVPEVFAPAMDSLAQTEIPVLLPDSLPDAGSPLYASARGDAERYAIDLGFVPDCRGNACMFGTIAARQGTGDYYEADETFERTIELADGTEAYFNPMVCGASCSSPVLEWEYGGARYRMEMKGLSEDAALGTLAGMANSAIAAGDRMAR